MRSQRTRATGCRDTRVNKPVVICTWIHVLVAVAIIPLGLNRLDLFVPLAMMTRNCIMCASSALEPRQTRYLFPPLCARALRYRITYRP